VIEKDGELNLELDLRGLDLQQEHPTSYGKNAIGGMISSLCVVPKYFRFKVKEMFVNQKVMMLIDLGATHNLIDEEFMHKKGLKTKEFEGFRFTNANEKLTLVDKILEKFDVRVQDYVAREDFYVYPLDDIPHLILGVQWLYKLGDIRSKYQKLVMRFEVDGRNTLCKASRITFLRLHLFI